jgi:hypothetical protein
MEVAPQTAGVRFQIMEAAREHPPRRKEEDPKVTKETQAGLDGLRCAQVTTPAETVLPVADTLWVRRLSDERPQNLREPSYSSGPSWWKLLSLCHRLKSHPNCGSLSCNFSAKLVSFCDLGVRAGFPRAQLSQNGGATARSAREFSPARRRRAGARPQRAGWSWRRRH